jgi:hypothetical protein
VPPVVPPAPSPGNGCWPGPAILAVKIGFRPPPAAPPVKIGCRYAASPVVLLPSQCEVKMILSLPDKIKGRSAVDHSTRARADNAPTERPKKSREQISGEVFFSGSRFAGLFRLASLRQRRWQGDTTATDFRWFAPRGFFPTDWTSLNLKGRLQYHGFSTFTSSEETPMNTATASQNKLVSMSKRRLHAICRRFGIDTPELLRVWEGFVFYGKAPSKVMGLKAVDRFYCHPGYANCFHAVIRALSDAYFKEKGIRFPPATYVCKVPYESLLV